MTVSPNSNNRCFVPLAQGYTTASGMATNTGLHVTSSDTISLYTITLGYPNVEYTCVLPTEMLGTDYMVQSYPADRYNSEFTIVATEDSTIVDIQLNGNASDGHTSGQSYSISLPRAGKAYPLKSTVPGDLSGTKIHARGDKKIAVFNGDACAYIPNRAIGRSCDHIVEQAIPTTYWGKEFIVPASRSPRVDYVRVTSLNDNCTVSVNGNQATLLNSGGTYEYALATTYSIDYIQTSQPAIVYLYFPSMDGNGDGDPSMTTIAPVEQSMTHCRFPIITTSNIYQHNAHVICRTSSTGNIFIDGNPAASSFQSIATAPQYSYARLSMQDGIHSISSNDTGGYIAYITGAGSRVSYGYCLGYACKDLTRSEVSMLADERNVALSPNGLDRCVGDVVVFDIQSPDSILYVRWSVNGHPFSATPLSYQFTDTGLYRVCTYVNSMVRGKDTIFRDTICTTVRVHPVYQYHIDDTCVENQLPVRIGRHLYSSDTVDTLHLTTVHRCDSTIFYSLKVWKNTSIRFDTLVCDTLMPFLWRGILFHYDSTVTLHLTDCHGADSIVTLCLNTLPCTPPPPPPQEPPVDSTYIWAPNVFTPDATENNRFIIQFSPDIVSAEVSIFHRWGDQICQFDGLTESWDGTARQMPCPQDTYVYRIVYRTANAKTSPPPIFGSVTLLR